MKHDQSITGHTHTHTPFIVSFTNKAKLESQLLTHSANHCSTMWQIFIQFLKGMDTQYGDTDVRITRLEQHSVGDHPR